LFDFKPVHVLSLESVLEIIAEAKERFGIEGVTFLGGEPTLQQGLAELSIEIRKTGLGVILFTGRKAEELNEELKTAVDIIIDGGFESDKPDDKRNLIGSANQRLIFITGRYQSFEEWFFSHRPKRMEINISDGLFMTGDKIL
jgi:anaerobic ribonucleoside-triphosphate reductase activating protein